MPKTIGSGTLKLAPNSSKITVIPSAAYTLAADTPIQSTVIKGTDRYDQFHGLIDITAVVGACLLDVYIQGLAADGVSWFDMMHVTQLAPVAAQQQIFSYRAVGVQDAALTNATMGVGSTSFTIPSQMRVWCVLSGGTSMTFSIAMEFIRKPLR